MVAYVGTNKEVVFPEFIEGKEYQIADGAFSHNKFTDVVIPESVKTMGFRAFEGSSVIKVSIAGITALDDYSFDNCASLKEIVFSDALETVKHSVFRNCISLEGVNLPKSLKSIATYAFLDCR